MTSPRKGTGKATTWFPVEGDSCENRERRPEEVSQEKKGKNTV